MRLGGQDTDVSQFLDLEARIKALELHNVRHFSPTAAATIDLGSVEGENITGIRISAHGLVSITGGATANVYLKPNGLPTVTASHVMQRSWITDPTTGAAMHDAAGTGQSAATQPGLLVGVAGWSQPANTISFDGTLFTKGHRRHWLGQFLYQDAVGNAYNILSGRLATQWNNSVTPITSLALVLTTPGTTVGFTGSVSMEIIP